MIVRMHEMPSLRAVALPVHLLRSADYYFRMWDGSRRSGRTSVKSRCAPDYLVILNNAALSVPSTNRRCSWKHRPAMVLSVFHTY